MQYFVSRHIGAHEWAARKGFNVQVVTHFDTEIVQDGDTIIGTLPIHLAARVCERGGRYLHLILDLTADDRGKEISADRMSDLGARIEEYRVYHRSV
jgi:CRISPR-associated protein Csx16